MKITLNCQPIFKKVISFRSNNFAIKSKLQCDLFKKTGSVVQKPSANKG